MFLARWLFFCLRVLSHTGVKLSIGPNIHGISEINQYSHWNLSTANCPLLLASVSPWQLKVLSGFYSNGQQEKRNWCVPGQAQKYLEDMDKHRSLLPTKSNSMGLFVKLSQAWSALFSKCDAKERRWESLHVKRWRIAFLKYRSPCPLNMFLFADSF